MGKQYDHNFQSQNYFKIQNKLNNILIIRFLLLHLKTARKIFGLHLTLFLSYDKRNRKSFVVPALEMIVLRKFPKKTYFCYILQKREFTCNNFTEYEW